MGATCIASELALRRALRRIADGFSHRTDADYDFIIQIFEEDATTRWTVAATVSVPWMPNDVVEYQAALDAVRTRLPTISGLSRSSGGQDDRTSPIVRRAIAP